MNMVYLLCLCFFHFYLIKANIFLASAKDFKLAFKLFDVNGNGELDKAEFEYVQVITLKKVFKLII